MRKTYIHLLVDIQEGLSREKKKMDRIAELETDLALTRLEMREHRKDRSTRP